MDTHARCGAAEIQYHGATDQSVGYPYDAAMLADGTYDVMVVDAEASSDVAGAISVELTVLAGEHKGEMVTVSAVGIDRDPLDLLAVPGTLLVADATPALTLEG